ncbi:MAG: hypothetical protein JWQ03_1305 [Variovorax sp.]|nr:hypothetical protein [Variovorax sp.]
MNTMIRMLIALPLLGITLASPAAEILFEGQRLRVIGTLDGSGLPRFSEQLASGRAHTVVFEDSRGGSAEVAEDYARAIHAAGVNTEVRGQCAAACVYAFLAGREHRFGRGPQVNSLLIPLGTRPQSDDLTGLQSYAEAQKVGIETEGMANGEAPGAMPQRVPAAVRQAWRPEQGVLFTSKPTLFGRIYTSYYCDGTQGRDTSRCETLNGIDPFQLGLLTGQ